MKKITKGVRVFVSKEGLQKSCSKSDIDKFGDTEQTAFDIQEMNGEQYVSVSPRCSVPLSACKPL